MQKTWFKIDIQKVEGKDHLSQIIKYSFNPSSEFDQIREEHRPHYDNT